MIRIESKRKKQALLISIIDLHILRKGKSCD